MRHFWDLPVSSKSRTRRKRRAGRIESRLRPSPKVVRTRRLIPRPRPAKSSTGWGLSRQVSNTGSKLTAEAEWIKQLVSIEPKRLIRRSSGVLARKPGALRNGARSRIGCCRQHWTASGASSPAPTTATGRWSRLVLGLDPRILAAVLTDGLPAVEAACAQALAENFHSADVVLNILARRRDFLNLEKPWSFQWLAGRSAVCGLRSAYFRRAPA
jgi:hypothetical protein